MTAVLCSVKNKFSETVSAVKNFRIDKNKLIDLLLILLMWLVIFDPPFIIGFNILHIIGGASLVYLLFKRKYWLPLIKFEAVLGAFFAYIAVVSYLNGISFCDILHSYVVYWIIDIVPISFVFVDICKIRKYNYDKFEQLIIGAGIVFTVISISAIISTSIHDFYFDYLNKVGLIKNKSLSVRTYGFASNLLYSSPMACAIIGAICMKNFALKNKIYYLLLSAAMMLVSYYNARVTLFVFAVGCLAVFFTYKKHRLKLFIIGASLIAVVVILFLCLHFEVFGKHKGHIGWLYDGLLNIFGWMVGVSRDSKGFYDAFAYYVKPEHYIYPQNILSIIFGTGETILGDNSYGVHTDIGFVNDVWYGGYVYVIAAYTAIIAFCRKLKERLPRCTDDKFIGTFWVFTFVATFIIANIKGIFVCFNNVTTLMWLLLVFAVLRRKKLSADDFPLFKKKKVG